MKRLRPMINSEVDETRDVELLSAVTHVNSFHVLPSSGSDEVKDLFFTTKPPHSLLRLVAVNRSHSPDQVKTYLSVG